MLPVSTAGILGGGGTVGGVVQIVEEEMYLKKNVTLDGLRTGGIIDGEHATIRNQ